MIQPLIFGAIFLIALTIHEFAHSLVADKMGDPNPRISGRLSLNPLVHLDPLGTIILPLFLILSGSPLIFGWAKPVEVDIFNFRRPRRDMGLVSLAGPVANIILAVFLSLVLRILDSTVLLQTNWVTSFLAILIINNLSIAVFNLLPVHPLDGGKILVGFLPAKKAYAVDQFLNRYGQILLIFLIFPFFGFSLISLVISPIVNFLIRLLINPGLLV